MALCAALLAAVAGFAPSVSLGDPAVAATPSAACPFGTAEHAPTSMATFNNPTSTDAADQDAIVDQMEDLICSVPAVAPTTATARKPTIYLAMYHYNGTTGEDITADLLWALNTQNAVIGVALDGHYGSANVIAGIPTADLTVCGHAPLATDSSCAGNKILHTKLLLVSEAGSARDVILMGSQNVTPQAESQAFNNSAQIVGNTAAYNSQVKYFSLIFQNKQRPNLGAPSNWPSTQSVVHGLGLKDYFFPRNSDGKLPPTTAYNAASDAATDPVANILSNVRCSKPGLRAGGHDVKVPRSIVRIAMFDFQDRGQITNQLVRLSNAGCLVEVIYDSMDAGTESALAGAKIQLRPLVDNAFVDASGVTRCVYVHDKFLLISGAYGSSGGKRAVPDQKIVVTGSENYLQTALHHNDEIMAKIAQTATASPVSTPIFTSYNKEWLYLRSLRLPANRSGCGAGQG
jgi:hypothetical protein